MANLHRSRKTKDGPQARRLLALATIYDGGTRTEAAKIGGVGLQIIRDWVLRFNARGPDGLASSRKRRAAIKAFLAFRSSKLLSKIMGWAQAGQITDRPLRIIEWCSLKVLVHFPQTILILDICNSAQSQHTFSAQDCNRRHVNKE
jgi:hypothetical protein